ncbi:MAG: UDP-N-acetylmuramoyl-L-alanyl-D-glutamate--2,6-diaminopimelate ligase [Verrucomicrobiaceae bacterium]|nr:UDP-N-acetylmuramoyl-L-alanyl-D-glutamate--2,6-diaminopimelate ligase [Verrucomicrobiaceae bacterium]
MAAALRFESGKPLGELLPEAASVWAKLHVTGLALDSRQVHPGDLFLAYPGEASDGRSFVDQAIANGAIAVAAEAGFERADLGVPVLKVADLRAQVSKIADRFYDQPSKAVGVIGVTGTNGKTSTTQLLAHALRMAGQSCGVIGTLGNNLDSAISSGNLTTPDPIALQHQLALWRDQGVAHAAMEVSSHGLTQGRVNGVRFRGAVFTNLSRDHLDFHGSMEKYGAAKASLFDMPALEFAVINRDDAFGAALAHKLRARLPVFDYSLQPGAAISVVQVDYRADGVLAKIATPWGAINAHSYLLGDFNLSNLLAVIAVLGQMGFNAVQIEGLLPKLKPIAGRMQRVDANADIEVVVDYAHTPDALEHALTALRQHCSGQLWCVFGCGGDRDKGKRPLMGEIAARLADRVVLTSDNPRSEDAQTIIDAIRAGFTGPALIESDRASAIALAIKQAQAGDIVLLAGKGHEDYQLIGKEVRPFSDVTVARAVLLARDANDSARGPA